MNDILDIASANLLSPAVLAFALGIAATLIKSDLKIPDSIYSALTIYLLLAVGLKGGVSLSESSLSQVALPLLATLLLGILTPILAYGVLRRLGKFDPTNSAAIAAHYGSVSAVTFFACQAYLQTAGVFYEGFVAVLLAVLEVPGLIVALLLVKRKLSPGIPLAHSLREIMSGKSIVLLCGGILIGLLTGPEKFDRVTPFFVEPFQGALVIFLLDMGMLAARRLHDLRKAGAFLVSFGILMPILLGAMGVWVGYISGLSLGGAIILGTMSASASYIAAPAAVRIALPEANPTYYLTASLGVTFPFNLTLGMPLYTLMAQALYAR